MIKITHVAYIVFSILAISACTDKKIKTADHFEVVDLPDGSVVYLNHNSSIAYDPGFKDRSVEVTGEVFFDVAGSDAPFNVITTHGEVRVLGTEFNVKAGAEELEVEVEEGVVELKTAADIQKIKRGEQGVWKKSSKAIRKSKAKLKFHVWLNNLEKEFKLLGREIKRGTKEVRKESKKAGRDLSKELKKVKKELKDN